VAICILKYATGGFFHVTLTFTIYNISFHTNTSADEYITCKLFAVHPEKLFFYCLTMQNACLHLTSLSTSKDTCLLGVLDTQNFIKFKKVWDDMKCESL
jgi:hypothetical protein